MSVIIKSARCITDSNCDMAEKNSEDTAKKRTRKPGWTLYEITPKVKKIVRQYALDNDLQLGEAVNEIIEQWHNHKDDQK